MSRRSVRQRQTQLAFTPLPASSPARASQPEAVRDRAAAVTLNMLPRASRKRPSANESLPTPSHSFRNNNNDTWQELAMKSSPSSRKSRRSFMSTNGISSSAIRKSREQLPLDDLDEPDSEASEQTPPPNKNRPILLDDSDSDEVVVASAKKRRASRPAEIDTDSDVIAVSPTKKPRTSSILDDSDSDDVIARPRKRVFTSSAAAVDSDSDVAVTSSARKSIRRGKQDSESEAEAPVARSTRSHAKSTAEATTPIARSSRSHPRTTVETLSDSSTTSIAENDGINDTEEDEPARSSARRANDKKRGTSDKKKVSRQDKDDLAEDLEFLESTDTPPTVKKQSKQSAKQKALDALKKRRSKQGGKDSNPTTRHQMTISSEEEDEAGDDVEEYLSEDNPDELAYMETEDLDEDDNEFVIQDETSMLGAPVELPVQFSRYQTMKPEALFKFAVEWMVQKKLNPAFEMDDEIYRFSFGRLDDFVKGMGGSKYQSSVWTSDFSKSLKSRPVLEDHRFINSGLLHDRCDACNRSGHPATWEVRFTGNCYDRNSLEEDSDEEDSDEEAPSVPSPTTTYYIGKFCMQNARTAHALAHWRFHLNQWVVDFLKEEAYCTAEMIVQRDSWSIKKRRKYANKVVDKMEEAGEIKRLHRDFRNEINAAQLANETRWDNSSP